MNSFFLAALITSTPPPEGETSGGGVLGLDNVRLELPLAGVGSRTLAAGIDHTFLLLFQVIWIIGGAISFGLLNVGAGWAAAFLIFGFFLLQWGYFAVLEISMGGQTPGKRLVGLRTVAFHGGRPTAAALLIRNLLRSLDLVVGLPLMAVDSRARRLGDFVAGTLVIHEQREEEAQEEFRMLRHPPSWGAREVSVVETFLRRERFLDRSRAYGMAEQLLAWIQRQEKAFVAEAPAAEPGADPVRRLRQIFEARV